MCGICGFNWEDRELLKRMTDILEYRGPDDFGFYTDKNLSLGHRRLSIIDLKAGRQPIFNEDKSIVVIYNGEIYNFREVRKKLEEKNHRFYTNSDTEVIVHAYEEYGEDCVQLFNGMFAFALYDIKNKKLILTRDRVGIKPLFYYFDGKKFIFASEVKAILQDETIKREIDKESVHYLLNLRYIPGEKTMFGGIKKILPGQILIYLDNKINKKIYWKLNVQIKDYSEEYIIKKLRLYIEGAVRRQMVSDVPISSYLSGGLDSSTIVAFASKYNEKPLKTFCMGFDEPTDEFKDARIVADYYNTEHKELIVKFEFIKSIPQRTWCIDMPKRNTWPYFISELVKKYTKVVFGGIGGDELFGGYAYRYLLSDKVRKLHLSITNKIKYPHMFIPLPHGTIRKKFSRALIELQARYGRINDDWLIRHLLGLELYDDDAGQYLLISHHNKLYSDKSYLKKVYGDSLDLKKLPDLRKVFEPYFDRTKNHNLNYLEKIFLAEFNTKLQYDFLPVEDSTSMIHSLESRVPFLDNDLIDFCFSIPSKFKVKNKESKVVLRKAMKPFLPKKIIKKEKKGFNPDTFNIYKKELREFALQNYENNFLIKNNFLKRGFIEKVLHSKPTPKLGMHYNLIWDMIEFDVWHKLYFEGDIQKPILDMDKLY